MFNYDILFRKFKTIYEAFNVVKGLFLIKNSIPSSLAKYNNNIVFEVKATLIRTEYVYTL